MRERILAWRDLKHRSEFIIMTVTQEMTYSGYNNSWVFCNSFQSFIYLATLFEQGRANCAGFVRTDTASVA